MSERSIGVVEGASAALVGAGIVTLALFPLALPLIALTGVALMPFIVVGLALVLIAVPPLLVARWLRRRAWCGGFSSTVFPAARCQSTNSPRRTANIG